jgi:hypothetical protein
MRMTGACLRTTVTVMPAVNWGIAWLLLKTGGV